VSRLPRPHTSLQNRETRPKHPQAKPAPLSSALALAADFKAGEWDISVGGIVNAYDTSTRSSGSQAVSSAALASKALGCAGKDGRTLGTARSRSAATRACSAP
jgi:hypothetical protein